MLFDGGNITCEIIKENEKILCDGVEFVPYENDIAAAGSEAFYIDLGVCVALVLGAGVCSWWCLQYTSS